MQFESNFNLVGEISFDINSAYYLVPQKSADLGPAENLNEQGLAPRLRLSPVATLSATCASSNH